MLILGIVMVATGFVCALLPAFPAGILYWCIAFALTVLYPLLLASFFKSNRADYEFRLLHWVPAGMTVLWLLFELLSYRFEVAHTAQLGFFALWSLPLVALGIILSIVFSAHVIRRRNVRISFLTLLLVGFSGLAYVAQVNHWNAPLQAALFPQGGINSVAATGYKSLAGLFNTMRFPGGEHSVSSSSEAMSSAPSSMIAVNPSSSRSSSVAMASDAATTVAAAVNGKPRRLTKTGPEETLGLLMVTLLAGYCMVLHARARSRVGVEFAA